MDVEGLHRRFRSLERARGSLSRTLGIGDWTFALGGLDEALADDLDRRWGGFVEDGETAGATLSVDLVDGGEDGWLVAAGAGEDYRIESETVDGAPLVTSYNFAALPGAPDRWKAAISRSTDEPMMRTVENLVRYLAARTAVEAGGFAMHGAGVLRGDRAHLFCGKSGSGKSTAVALSAPATPLGDDFAIALPAAPG